MPLNGQEKRNFHSIWICLCLLQFSTCLWHPLLKLCAERKFLKLFYGTACRLGKFFLPKKFLCFWWIKFFNYFTMAWWFFILKNIQTMQLNHQSAGKKIIKEEKESWTYMMRIQLYRIPSSERGKNQFLFLPAPHNSSYSLLLLLLFFYNFFSLFLHQRTVQL